MSFRSILKVSISAAVIAFAASGVKAAEVEVLQGHNFDIRQRHPEVTRERLYLETMEEVLGRTPKIILDVSDGPGNIMYLPLDQLMKRHGAGAARSETQSEHRAEQVEDADRRAREALRARGGRR
jgi:hypothetical protein